MKRIKDILFRWSARVFLASIALFLVGLIAGCPALAARSFAAALVSFAVVAFTGVRTDAEYLRDHTEDL